MKPTCILLTLAALLTAPLMAQSPTAENRGKNLTTEQKQKILKKFDKDGDGKLNEQEAQAAKAALQARKARMGQ